MPKTSTTLKHLSNSIASMLGFESRDIDENNVAAASLSPVAFGSIKLKRLVPSEFGDSNETGPTERFTKETDVIEVELGSGGPVSGDTALYATTAFYALGGGTIPVALSSAAYAFAPTSAYFINSDLALTVTGPESIRIEDLNMIPQDIIPKSVDSTSLNFSSPTVFYNGLVSTPVTSASSPCGDTLAVVTLNPVTVWTYKDLDSGVYERTFVYQRVVTGASSVAPEYQLEFVTDDLVFLGLRGSSTGYWVNVNTGTVSLASLFGPLVGCYASESQFGVPSVVVAVTTGTGFDLRLAVHGSQSSAPLLQRSGRFSDLLVYNDVCLLVSVVGANFVIETIYDFNTSQRTITVPLPTSPVLEPRKIFACDGEALILFVSATTSVPMRLFKLGSQSFIPNVLGTDAINLGLQKRIQYFPSCLGHIFYYDSSAPLIRVSRVGHPIDVIINSQSLNAVGLMRGMCIGFKNTSFVLFKQFRTSTTNVYARILTNQSESSIIRPYPELVSAGTQNRIYTPGSGGYYSFTPISSPLWDDLGIVGMVDRQGEKFGIQLLAALQPGGGTVGRIGYLEPVLIPLGPFTIDPSNPYPDGAITYVSFPFRAIHDVVSAYSYITVAGVQTRVFDMRFFRHQIYWLSEYSRYCRDYGLGDPNPFHTEVYTSWDCAIAVQWNVLYQKTDSTVVTALSYMNIAVPGLTFESLSLNSDLSVDSMDIQGIKTPDGQSGESWFGYLPSDNQTLANSGHIFGFSSIIDTGS
jgi:hypothetical protein